MSVKNIARNLFVCGALVLSGGAVCGRLVCACDEEKAKKVCEDFHMEMYEEFIDPLINVLKEKLRCWENYSNCLDVVISNSTLYTNECKTQRDNCFDKVWQDYVTIYKKLDAKGKELEPMKQELY